MRTLLATLCIVALVCTPILGEAVLDRLQDRVHDLLQNLSEDKEVTATIRAFDRKFFKGFAVYASGTDADPTALLFDRKDDYHLPTRFWGSPLSEEKVIYAIERLDYQYEDAGGAGGAIPFAPRALKIINVKGEVLGYCYTGLISSSILMDRKKEDGSVTVYPPSSADQPASGAGGSGGR